MKERIAPYKYPRYVWIVPDLAKGPSGKILPRGAPPGGPSMTAASDHSDHETAQAEAHDAAGPLDLLLTRATAGALGSFRPDFAAVRFAPS